MLIKQNLLFQFSIFATRLWCHYCSIRDRREFRSKRIRTRDQILRRHLWQTWTIPPCSDHSIRLLDSLQGNDRKKAPSPLLVLCAFTKILIQYANPNMTLESQTKSTNCHWHSRNTALSSGSIKIILLKLVIIFMTFETEYKEFQRWSEVWIGDSEYEPAVGDLATFHKVY